MKFYMFREPPLTLLTCMLHGVMLHVVQCDQRETKKKMSETNQ